MNQLAMLPKAARMQAQIKEQLEAKAAKHAPVAPSLDFLFSEGGTFKFS